MQNLPKKVRSKKLSSRVDLTAMVSVSFLLIIFFMVATELRKPKAVDLSLPNYDASTCGGDGGCRMGSDNRIITVILDDNDKIITYSGLFGFYEFLPKKIDFGRNGIRKELKERQNAILDYSAKIGRTNRGAIVIIKPSKKSNFKNLVDILDEMAIAKIDTYAIVNDFTPEESKLLASN
ncbi:biopolymer transporter ExbD [Flavobacterium sp. ACN6]|uniref:ExbD/TolR family protein n=1 Tax=Flavobacterium sp. ACN6 TaxID=1920426 RepID=UPI000BB2FB5D|nr:biopolymer transporter ExbD [Flavobacterium sp. ACN6]PBJ15626.1 Biopolymer transport protein ExbD/TolR [Flavobacterium sp. ACN6]